ncbi:hypothetical protein [Erythrobacter sp. A6_0]|jgi:hydroxylaminobenzene mutase|uniref:hypothetical protein n=1 Tax=Erythrobacter sp. A6_0 TaxID=2821089 RepID=UPI001ADA82B0|nr:hypothetical protein [Erythrobacter sp. A6_0]MBO9511738.1 hypothetical protein [Erythrobacter sp. A6_0]|tara:strand:+ start:1337 stop:1768 length:432 start_codon:yes stop_codon:yes gene_type:complete
MQDAARMPILAGAILFLLGLIEGALVQSFLNPRMALSAHLTAVQSGMALMIFGLVWRWVALPSLWSAMARWSVAAGIYSLWFGLTLSAATGAGDSLPIAGAGYDAGPLAQTMVSVLVLGGSAGMTVGWSLFVVGLVRGFRTER